MLPLFDEHKKMQQYLYLLQYNCKLVGGYGDFKGKKYVAISFYLQLRTVKHGLKPCFGVDRSEEHGQTNVGLGRKCVQQVRCCGQTGGLGLCHPR